MANFNPPIDSLPINCSIDEMMLSVTDIESHNHCIIQSLTMSMNHIAIIQEGLAYLSHGVLSELNLLLSGFCNKNL